MHFRQHSNIKHKNLYCSHNPLPGVTVRVHNSLRADGNPKNAKKESLHSCKQCLRDLSVQRNITRIEGENKRNVRDFCTKGFKSCSVCLT